MKKMLCSLALAAILFFGMPSPIFAVDIGIGNDSGMAQSIAQKAGYDVSGDQYTLSRTIGGIIRAVLSVIGVIFLVLTIYAGVLWMTAAGAEDKITKAQSILRAAVIGLIIVVAAYGITALVFNFIIGAQAPSTDTGGYSPSMQMGCCYNRASNECMQTATLAACNVKWSGGYWYAGESCTPNIQRSTGCAIIIE